MSKYRRASASFVLNELEAICDILIRGTQTETDIAMQFKKLIHTLRDYYNEQGWI